MSTKVFPLRMPPSMRARMDELALTEGASLNHLICTAIAEKLARIEHSVWLGEERRKGLQTPTQRREGS